MVLKTICPPALIYLVFSLTQVSIDTMRGMYNLAFIKIWVAFVFTVLLNYLCLSGLGVISWLIVFIPFILMTIIVSMLLLMFGLDPTSGKIKKPKSHLTRDEKKAVSVAEMLAKDREENPVDYDYQPTTHGKTKISSNERKVLNDMVQKRTTLTKDPLQNK
jgi:uncharacterized membrane protein